MYNHSYPLIIIILLFSYVSSQSSSDTDTAVNITLAQEPKLIRSDPCPFPPDLIKNGVEGVVLLDLYIDAKGAVEEVVIVQNAHPVLDSIAQNTAYQFLFSPIWENGKAIPVVIRYQYVFNLSHILKHMDYTPNFIGKVVDAHTQKPFRNLPIVCDFIDTTVDSALSIPFAHYIKFISQVPTQYCMEGKLITRTDSLGNFRFFLLPVCSLKVRVNPLYHNLFITGEVIVQEKITKSLYKLTPISDPVAESDYEITVYGKKSTHERINVLQTELRYGLTDDINRIMFVKSAINQVPERGSSILIHGGGIYDNAYLISEIPVFPPSHFTNYPTLDISGTMVSALEDVSIISSRVGGRYANPPGCVIAMQPGIYRPAKKKWIKRPELVVNMSTRLMDFTLSTPLRKEKDLYQIAYKFANLGFFKSWQNYYRRSHFGLAPPLYYGDLTLTGRSRMNRLNVNSLLWFAWDTYDSSAFYNKQRIPWGTYKQSKFYNKHRIPWGIGSISIESAKRSPLHRVVIGGSSQC